MSPVPLGQPATCFWYGEWSREADRYVTWARVRQPAWAAMQVPPSAMLQAAASPVPGRGENRELHLPPALAPTPAGAGLPLATCSRSHAGFPAARGVVRDSLCPLQLLWFLPQEPSIQKSIPPTKEYAMGQPCAALPRTEQDMKLLPHHSILPLLQLENQGHGPPPRGTEQPLPDALGRGRRVQGEPEPCWLWPTPEPAASQPSPLGSQSKTRQGKGQSSPRRKKLPISFWGSWEWGWRRGCFQTRDSQHASWLARPSGTDRLATGGRR